MVFDYPYVNKNENLYLNVYIDNVETEMTCMSFAIHQISGKCRLDDKDSKLARVQPKFIMYFAVPTRKINQATISRKIGFFSNNTKTLKIEPFDLLNFGRKTPLFNFGEFTLRNTLYLGRYNNSVFKYTVKPAHLISRKIGTFSKRDFFVTLLFVF